MSRVDKPTHSVSKKECTRCYYHQEAEFSLEYSDSVDLLRLRVSLVEKHSNRVEI